MAGLADYLAQAAPTYEPTGTGNWLTAGLGSGIFGAASELGSAAEAGGRLLGANDFADQAKDFANRQRATAATWARPDLEGSWSPTGIAYQLTQGLPTLAAAMGGGALAGLALPEEGAAAAVGGIGALAARLGPTATRAIGAGAAMYPGAVGGNVQRAEEYYGDLDRGTAAKALAFGVPEAAAMSILPARIEEGLAKGVAVKDGANWLQRAMVGAKTGVYTGAPATAAADMFTQWMGDPNRTFAEHMGEIVHSAISGGIQGGVMGGAFGALSPLAQKPADKTTTEDLNKSTKDVLEPSAPEPAEEEQPFQEARRPEPPVWPEVGSKPWREGFGGDAAREEEAALRELAGGPKAEIPQDYDIGAGYEPPPIDTGIPGAEAPGILESDRVKPGGTPVVPYPADLTPRQQAQIMLNGDPKAARATLQGMDEDPFRVVQNQVRNGDLKDPSGVVQEDVNRRYEQYNGAADKAWAANPLAGSPEQVRTKLQALKDDQFTKWHGEFDWIKGLEPTETSSKTGIAFIREEVARRNAEALEAARFKPEAFKENFTRRKLGKILSDKIDASGVTDEKGAAETVFKTVLAMQDQHPSPQLRVQNHVNDLGRQFGILDNKAIPDFIGDWKTRAEATGKEPAEVPAGIAKLDQQEAAAPLKPSSAPTREAAEKVGEKYPTRLDLYNRLDTARGQIDPNAANQQALHDTIDKLQTSVVYPEGNGSAAWNAAKAAVPKLERTIAAQADAAKIKPALSAEPTIAADPARPPMSERAADTISKIKPRIKGKVIPETPLISETNPVTQDDIDLGHVINQSSDIKDVLGHLRTHGPTGFVKEMADWLHADASGPIEFAEPEGRTFDTDRVLTPNQAVKGSYNAALNRSSIYSSDDLATTVLHEAAHSATLKGYARGGPGAQEMDGVWARLQAREGINKPFGIDNVKELMAQAPSNPVLAEFLKSERVTTGSKITDMWQMFKNAAFKILGMPERMRSLYDQVMDSTMRVMQEGRARDGADPALADVETPRVKADNALHEIARTTQPLLDWAKDKWLDLSATWRPMVASWLDADHIATLNAKTIPHATSFVEATRTRQTRGDLLSAPASIALHHVDALEKAHKGATELLERLMTATSQGLDPRKLFGAHTWLEKLPGAIKAILSDDHAKLRVDWNNLARIKGPNGEPLGEQAYESMRAFNSGAEYARQTQHLHELLARDHGVEVAGPNPMAEYHGKFELHDSPEKMEAFFKEKSAGLQKTAGDIRAQVVTNIDDLRKKIEDAKAKGEDTDILKSEQRGMVGSQKDLDSILRATKMSWDRLERAPYFHLGRDGDYYIAAHLARDAAGNVDDAKTMKLRDRLQTGGYNNVAIMRGLDNDTVYVRVDSPSQMRHMQDLFQGLHDEGVFDQTKPIAANKSTDGTMFNMIAPKYLQRAVDHLRALGPQIPEGSDGPTTAKIEKAHAMEIAELSRQLSASIPDNSYMALYQRRENVQGFATGMVNSFARSAELQAKGLASLSTKRDIAQASAGIMQDVKAANQNMALSANDKIATAQAAAELMIRENSHQNFVPKTILDGLRQLTHAVQIGISPVYIPMLQAQIFTHSLPRLGAVFGYAKSSQALMNAAGPAFKAMGAVIRGEDRINFGMRQMDLEKAGISKDDTDFWLTQNARGTFNFGSYGEQMGGHETRGQVDHILALMNATGRYAEMYPRLITAWAARDLFNQHAMRADMKATTMHDFVQKMVDRSQQTWLSAVNPRQTTKAGSFGIVSPIMNQFMLWNIKISEMYYRDIHDAFGGDTPEQKSQARKFLLGHLAAVAALSGTLGLPGAATAAGVIDRLADWVTNRDDWDLVASYRGFLNNTFGKDVGEAMARGVPRFFGVDFDKASEANVLLGSTAARVLSEKRKFEDAERDWLKAEAGPSLSFLTKLVLGGRDLLNGDYMEAMQRMAPEVVEGPLSAYKLSQRGFVDKNGTRLPITANAFDILLTAISALGDPAKEEDYFDTKRTETGLASMKGLREQNITRHLLLAVGRGDQQMFQKWASESTKFALDHPGLPPPMSSLAGTLQQHLREAALARAYGVPVGTNLKDVAARGMVSYGNYR